MAFIFAMIPHIIEKLMLSPELPILHNLVLQADFLCFINRVPLL